MFQLRACAVCFATDKKLLHIDKARLRNDLNWISGNENYPADGMPGYLCVMCTAYLRNCKKFRDKCQRAHYTLLELLRRNNQIKLAHLKAVDCTKLGVAHNLSYLDLNTRHYEEVKFQWVHFNRTGVKQQDSIPIAFCDIAEASYEVPAKKPKQIMTVDDDDNNVKLEKQFESLGESIECHDTVAKEEALDHIGADSEKDFDDNFFDGNCSIIANNQDSYEIPIEVNEKDTLENADGTDNEFEYATLVPMSFAEAKAALEVSKMFTKGEHKCDVCNRGYCNESRLNIHRRMHDKYVSGFFVCVHCNYYYKTDFLLQTHLKEKHMYKYLCRKCPEVSFSRTTAKQHYIRQHMRNDTNKKDDWQKRRPKWLCARGGKRVKGSKPKAGRKEPIAFCDIAEASYEVPAKKPKQIMTVDDDDNNVKLEKQFESLGESIECHDTVAKEEALDHISADSEKDFDDNFFDGNCSIIANNQDSYEIPIEVNEKDTLENADGTDNEFEYATLVPMSFAEAKAALEVSKMFTKGEHKCDVCNRGYCNESRLNIHRRMHDKYVSGFFVCVHCNYYYKTDFLLQTHLKEKHMYKYLCRKCPEVSFSRTTAKQHYIRQHMRNDTNKKDDWQKRRPKWLCARGGKRVKGSKPKAGRKEDHHRTPVRTGKPSAKTPEDFPIESPVSQEDQYRLILERKNTKNYLESDYKCQYCYKGFREEVTFNNHMKRHNPEISGPSQCDMCKLYFKNPRKVYKHVTTAHIFKYSCRVCKFFCFNKDQASAHYKWHNNVTYTCPHCNKVFKKISTQLTHIRLNHPSSSICNLCGHSFVSEAGLACHKRITHSEEELRAGEASLVAGPSCSDCGVQFASDRAYRTHLDSSTNHAPSANGKTSSGRPRLKRGRTEILNNGVATANHCEVCGKFLVNDVQARQHYETDHPGANYLKRYMCDVCGHTTKQYANLMVHMRTHTREKPYSCPHCDRKFSMTSSRDRHLVVHTGEKRYQCQHCSRRFTQSSAVKLHIQTVHLKIPYAPWDKKTRKRRKELEGAATGPISVVDPVNCLQPQHKLVLDTQGDYLNAYITYSDE